MVSNIGVELISESETGNVYEVTIGEPGDSTTHKVTLPAEYYKRLTRGQIGESELIRRSFEFLLSKEPKESILREFELSLIQRYFKDYEQTITID